MTANEPGRERRGMGYDTASWWDWAGPPWFKALSETRYGAHAREMIAYVRWDDIEPHTKFREWWH